MVQRIINKLLKYFYPPLRKVMPYQVYAYLVTGGANTVFNIILFTILYIFLNPEGTSYHRIPVLSFYALEIATTFSFLASLVTGYWLSKTFAFKNTTGRTEQDKTQFGRYFLVSVQGQFNDYLITKALIVFLGTVPIIAYLVSTVIMLIVNYLLQKYYTFKNRKIA